MKRLIPLVLLIAFLGLTGCERVFTTSPLSFLQRDPSTYSPEQRIAYANDALASGDEAAMAAAYELLATSSDPQTQLLAVELAIGAAGLESAVTSMIGGLLADGADPNAVVGAALDGFTDEDLALLVGAASLLESADDSVDPSAEQYAFVAIGLIAAAANDADGIENLNPPPADTPAETYVTQATGFFDAAEVLIAQDGGSTDLIEGFTGLIP